MTGPATCPVCRKSKLREAKLRYVQSEKGKATTRAREDRPDVKAKRRIASASDVGRARQARYAKTAKGKAKARQRAAAYSASEKGKQKAREQHLATKGTQRRIAQKQRAYVAYAKTAKMAAKKRRDYARRKAALVADAPFTAEMWIALVERHKHRCHYCGRKRVLTLDHVIPVSKGGTHTEANIVPACRSCNSAKGDRIVLIC